MHCYSLGHCSKKGKLKRRMSQVPAAHFVFVHGASHGAWCWYKIRALLEKVGHTVTCIDLASAGINTSDPKNIVDFEEYNQPFSDFMAKVPENEKVILVGHSLGGFCVTHAIHKFGEKIQLAVYLAAVMLKTNTGGAPPTLPAEDVEFDWSGNTPTVIIKQEALHKLLYNRSPSEDLALASMLLRPCPMVFPIAEDGGDPYVDKVRRVFVKTIADNMMNSSAQEEMIKGWPPAQTFEVDSDHSAFFSAPTQLVSILVEATRNAN